MQSEAGVPDAGTEPAGVEAAGVEAGLNGLELVDVPYDGPEAMVLTGELQQEYVVRYGGPDSTPLAPADFAAPTGAFLLALQDGETLGCAGLRRHDEETVELKRMYVRAAHRRRGVARALLLGVEDRARELGYRRLILETGMKQPEALAFYPAHGYAPIENYGYHRGSGGARSFIKTL